ncbi:MAG: 3-deoxy-8-phosphooctulonate synthase [Planctomycetota bacterium]
MIRPRTTTRPCAVGPVTIGDRGSLAILAGPCVLESLELGLRIGEHAREACSAAGVDMVFKASFDKANRSSIASPRGPGIERGLEWLATIRDRLGCPVVTDLHEPSQAEAVAQAVDLLQIPAFLCRQTDLLLAAGESAARHGRAVNIKKGQFLSPAEMRGPVRKVVEAGCSNVMLTERGTFFGYHRLVNDFIGLGDLMELDADGASPPVCFDATHSTQLPGATDQSGGRPERSPLLARAAAAAGVHALFIETHPDPASALSDGATQLPLDQFAALIQTAARVHRAARQ